MTNTYPDDAPLEVKTYEELRCLRCVLERILRVMDEGMFVDYQMEKFGRGSRLSSDEEERVHEMVKEGGSVYMAITDILRQRQEGEG